jgi:hypothetical protein
MNCNGPDLATPETVGAVQALANIHSAYAHHFFDEHGIFHWFLTNWVEIRRQPRTGRFP